MNTLELRRERATLAKEARKILDLADAEKRDLSGEENEKWNRLNAEIDALAGKIEREERLSSIERELATPIPPKAGPQDAGGGNDGDREAERSAFRAFLAGGMESLTVEQRGLMMTRAAALTPEQRALSVGTAAAGGYLVPQDFMKEIERAMLTFGGVREVARVIRTASGAALPWPTSNDTAQKGAILSENAQASEQDVTFGSVTLDAYMYTSKLVRVSLQLLQDSAFSVDSFLAQALGERIARILNEHFTTGTGTAQPKGVVTASVVGKTGLTGQTTSVIYDDLVDLEHSVDPSYRRNGRFMMADSVLKAIKKLKDGQSRPLWLPGLAVREPDTILGYPYTINQDMAAMAASAKSILFGDFSKYIIRDVLDVQLLRLQERYADYLQVGFLSFSRHDGDLIDAGTNPIKHYANSAT